MFTIFHVRSRQVLSLVPSEQDALRVTAALGRQYAYTRGRLPTTPPPPAKPRTSPTTTIPAKALPPVRNQLWIVDHILDEVVAVVRGDTLRDAVNTALLEMSRHTLNLDEARRQFTLSRQQPVGKAWKIRHIGYMPYGKYEGSTFDMIPWKYLDRIREGVTDPVLLASITRYLETVPEWRDYTFDENAVLEEVNHLRDFVPSESRGQ